MHDIDGVLLVRHHDNVHADRQTEWKIDFSAYLSKQKLFRMSTECQKDRATDRQRELQRDQQNDSMAEWQYCRMTE